MWGGHGGGGGGGMGMGHGGLDDEELGQIYNHDVVKRLYPYLKSQMGLFSLAMAMMAPAPVQIPSTAEMIG